MAVARTSPPARKVAREQIAISLPTRWLHVQGVGAQAEQIAPAFGGDGEDLIAACWLHDIGYAPALAHTGFHPLDGARFLRAEGWPERICGLVAHHSFADLEAELRGVEGLDEFENEDSAVRDAVWYCDMTTGPSGERVDVHQRLDEIVARYGPADVVSQFISRARSELVAAVERTERRLRAAV
ncbi:HD domain-containing protein [Antrihabitans sp. YC3-6]|uniref:HD domain-containing protein n=1 Tax=Antrihabitans stalagmiti TaxID=2799499 RepID=A0A934NWT9_9NOCA|nr:HD domain-containing protein [Antrihabitans stalagmiti]MBJ8343003.1 HD domain-containing protein [Antrihabitans stalagmiti]